MKWWNVLAAVVIFTKSCSPQATKTDEVEYLLNTGEQMDFDGVTDLVLLIGSTGVGKSTLAKFMVHDPSLQVVRAAKSRSKFLFTDNGTISTVTSKSMTLLPNVYKDPETGQVIVDCPGFSDTREPKYEIAASYFVKQVLDNAKRLKIILVENHFSLTEGSDRFGLQRLLTHVSELIPNINHFRGSMGLIANKVPNRVSVSDEDEKADIMAFMGNFGDDLRNDLSDHRLNTTVLKKTEGDLRALEVISSDGSGHNLALFRQPNKIGSPWDSTHLQTCYQDIRDLIFQRINWVDNANQVYKYTLTMTSIVFIKDSLVPINTKNTIDEIGKIMSSFMVKTDAKLSSDLTIAQKIEQSANLKTKFSALLNNIRTAKEIVALPENLSKIIKYDGADSKLIQRLVSKAQFYSDVGGISINIFLNEVKQELRKTEKKLDDSFQFYQFLQTLQAKLEEYGPLSVRDTSYSHISQAMNFKDFIFDSSKFHIDFENKKQILAIPLTGFLINDLNQVLSIHLNYKVNYVYNQKIKHLLIEGRNLLTSEINARLGAYPDLQTITLVAAKRIFIDHNLAVTNKNIYMAAPTFEVIGGREILLTGSNAAAYPGKAADSAVLREPGEGGHAGYPGSNSGNFLLLALDVIKPEKLTIKLVGGQGGRGQNAGNGHKGVASSYPSTGVIKLGDALQVDTSIRSQGYEVDRMGDFMEVINRKENVLPSRGGDGGVGGPGGQPGVFVVKVSKYLVANQIKVESVPGNQGEGGDGGEGGLGLPKCARKLYMCQKVDNLGICGKWYFLSEKLCVKSSDYKCYPNSMDFCPVNFPNGSIGNKGQSTVGAQANYPLTPIGYAHFWLILNERLGAYQSISPEFAEMHKFGQQNLNVVS